MSRWLVYLALWVVFAVRGLWVVIYRLLHFVSSRQGALFILPILAVIGLLQFRAELRDLLTRYVLIELRPGHTPSTLALDVLLVISLALVLLVRRLLARWMLFDEKLVIAVLIAVVMVYFRSSLHGQLTLLVHQYPLWQIPPPEMLDALLVVLCALAWLLYQPLTHTIWIILGLFAPPTWPIMPMRPLTAKSRRIRPVEVRMVVPRLPRRRWKLRLQTK